MIESIISASQRMKPTSRYSLRGFYETAVQVKVFFAFCFSLVGFLVFCYLRRFSLGLTIHPGLLYALWVSLRLGACGGPIQMNWGCNLKRGL
jgi:hypothetical protein